jgi:hypothetical protein
VFPMFGFCHTLNWTALPGYPHAPPG